MKKLLLLFYFLCTYTLSPGQNNFMSGSSTISIEPRNSIVSAALAGYGVPREGRFSLTWKSMDQPEPLRLITASGNKILAVNEDEELLEATIKDQVISWKNKGKTQRLSDIALSGSNLYAANSNGELLYCAVNDQKISWKKIRQKAALASITILKNKLYAISKDRALLEAEVSTKSVNWRTVGDAPGIVSLTNDDNMLYALNKGDTIFSVKPYMNKKAWTIIGRNNGITFNEHVARIAVGNNVIYAINDRHQLLKGDHKSNGDLAVNTLAIRNNMQTVVIAGVDVCGFDGSFINSIKEQVYKTRQILPSAILINASHTHFAPVTQSWATWGEFYHVPDTNYLNNIVKKSIIKSIEEALENMTPSDLFFGRGVTDIGINRRNTRNMIRPYDQTLDVIKILGADQKAKSILFSAGCHPVFENKGAESYTLAANYPAVARQYLSDNTHTPHTIFLQGCAGDINPKQSNYRATGTALGADVEQVLNGAMQKINPEISCFLDTVQIPVSPWSVEQIREFKKNNIVKKGDIEAEKNVRWADLMLERYSKNEVKTTLPVYVQTINIGQWKLVGLSREAVTQYGLAIRDLWPDKLLTVAGYCNDVSSYLPTDWHIETGVYEGFGSFFWYGQPGLPPKDILTRVVNHIKEKNR